MHGCTSSIPLAVFVGVYKVSGHPCENRGAFLCMAENEYLMRANFKKMSGSVFNSVTGFYCTGLMG